MTMSPVLVKCIKFEPDAEIGEKDGFRSAFIYEALRCKLNSPEIFKRLVARMSGKGTAMRGKRVIKIFPGVFKAAWQYLIGLGHNRNGCRLICAGMKIKGGHAGPPFRDITA